MVFQQAKPLSEHSDKYKWSTVIFEMGNKFCRIREKGNVKIWAQLMTSIGDWP